MPSTLSTHPLLSERIELLYGLDHPRARERLALDRLEDDFFKMREL